jgi:MSHA biogenesis protein MshP
MIRRQQGISIVAALFVVVVVAMLAAFAVTVGNAGQQTDDNHAQASRALAAARTGLEWGVYRARAANSCVASQVLSLSENALRGFRITVECAAAAHTEDGGATYYNSYDITAKASYGTFGAMDYAYREVSGRYYAPGH